VEAITVSPPLLVIVGETASGKSALAMRMAKKFNGEIIAGDGRTIYKGMDIGTAKPTLKERTTVPHHLIDELALDIPMTAPLFKEKALAAIGRVVSKGKLPILVGGSGLYIDSVLFDYAFLTPVDPAERVRLQQMTVMELQAELEARSIPAPTNNQNPRHLIRALETNGQRATRATLRPNTLLLGTHIERENLKERIVKRVNTMLDAGLEKEVKGLVETYGWNEQLTQTIGYKEFKNYLAGSETIEQVRAAIIKDTNAYAKRQRTWFKRNTAINYPCNESEAVDFITTWLNK
jgi:tRNA dimethylallyltransferase